jgi:hypothetical protein
LSDFFTRPVGSARDFVGAGALFISAPARTDNASL